MEKVVKAEVCRKGIKAVKFNFIQEIKEISGSPGRH